MYVSLQTFDHVDHHSILSYHLFPETQSYIMSSSWMPLRGSAGQIFIKSQFCTKAQAVPPTTSFENQTVIVTGSNCGLGFASCEATPGHKLAHLIMVVRNTDKGEIAASQLRKDYPDAQIDV